MLRFGQTCFKIYITFEKSLFCYKHPAITKTLHGLQKSNAHRDVKFHLWPLVMSHSCLSCRTGLRRGSKSAFGLVLLEVLSKDGTHCYEGLYVVSQNSPEHLVCLQRTTQSRSPAHSIFGSHMSRQGLWNSHHQPPLQSQMSVPFLAITCSRPATVASEWRRSG